MRLLVIFCLILMSMIVFASNLNIQYRKSRIHSLVIFSYSLSEVRGFSPAIKEAFLKSSFYNEQVKLIIDEQQKLNEHLAVYAEYKDPGVYYGDEFIVKNLIEVQASLSKDLDDLSGRTRGLLPVEIHQKFINNLRKLEPVFESFLWRPYEKELQKMVDFYSRKSSEWKLDEMFKKAKTFYGSYWDDSIPFDIVLYPIPPGSHHSNAKSFGAFESVGIIIDEKDIVGRVGVIFHEICHSLYSAQPAELKESLNHSLKIRSQNPFEAGAATYLNEILATVLGNGIVYEKIMGEVDKANWYNVAYINWGARDILDLTKKYLAEGKQIDEKYLKSLQDSFQKRFPDFDKEFNWLFSKVEINNFEKSFTTAEVRTSFKKSFRYESLSVSSLKKYLSKINWQETDVKSRILILTKTDLSILLKKNFYAKSILLKLSHVKRARSAYYYSKKENQIYLLVNEKQYLSEAFERLSINGHVEVNKPVIIN